MLFTMTDAATSRAKTVVLAAVAVGAVVFVEKAGVTFAAPCVVVVFCGVAAVAVCVVALLCVLDVEVLPCLPCVPMRLLSNAKAGAADRTSDKKIAVNTDNFFMEKPSLFRL